MYVSTVYNKIPLKNMLIVTKILKYWLMPLQVCKRNVENIYD